MFYWIQMETVRYAILSVAVTISKKRKKN